MAEVFRDKVRRWRELADRYSHKVGLDSTLVLAVIEQESGGDPRAKSPVGARGLMQLMPIAIRDLGEDPATVDLNDPETNLRLGTQYLAKMLKRFGGDEELALAAYNAGPTRVAKLGRVPDIPETQAYVEKIGTTLGRARAAPGAVPLSRPFAEGPRFEMRFGPPTLGGQELEAEMAREYETNPQAREYMGGLKGFLVEGGGALPLGALIAGAIGKAGGGSFDSGARGFAGGFLAGDEMTERKRQIEMQKVQMQQAQELHQVRLQEAARRKQQEAQAAREAQTDRAYQMLGAMKSLDMGVGSMKKFILANQDTFGITDEFAAELFATPDAEGRSMIDILGKARTAPDSLTDADLEHVRKVAPEMYGPLAKSVLEAGAAKDGAIGPDKANILARNSGLSVDEGGLAILGEMDMELATDTLKAWSEVQGEQKGTLLTGEKAFASYLDKLANDEPITDGERFAAETYANNNAAETMKTADQMYESAADASVDGNKELATRRLQFAQQLESMAYSSIDRLMDEDAKRDPGAYSEQFISDVIQGDRPGGHLETVQGTLAGALAERFGISTAEATEIATRHVLSYDKELRQKGYSSLDDLFETLPTTEQAERKKAGVGPPLIEPSTLKPGGLKRGLAEVFPFLTQPQKPAREAVPGRMR
jgi:hypothetical protein